ncbi:MAG: hypothetical protein JO127_01955 [Caulobacteraceae bacterium]|nr:hypothetical protein [Caulobacteraceae bacterium]
MSAPDPPVPARTSQGQDGAPDDQARETPDEVLTPEEKRKLGAEVSRTEDA